MVRGNVRNLLQGSSNDVESIRVLFLVDDITQEGGVRTRVTEEIACATSSRSIQPIVISRCNIRSLPSIPGLLASFTSELGVRRSDGFAYAKMPHSGLPIINELSVMLNLILSAILILPVAVVKRTSVIYAHNIECGLAGVVLSRLLGKKCIVDLHGLEVDEHFEMYSIKSDRGPRARFWRFIERFVITKSDVIVCVSAKHRTVIESTREDSTTIHVIPCFADETHFRHDPQNRKDIRARLKIHDDEVLFIHSGIVSKSAEGCDPITFFSRMTDIENRKLLVLVLNEAGERRVRQLAGAELGDKLTIMRCPRREVPKYLSAADVAMLIRADKRVNRVASPTKFGEYLLCGLPVIITPNIGDSSTLVEECRVGIVLSDNWTTQAESMPSPSEILSISADATRNACRETGVKHLSRKAWKGHYVNLIRDSVR